MNNDLEKEALWLLKEKYNGEKSTDFEKDLELLSAGTPLAYVIGNIPFCGAFIDLEYKPLIPRAETEYWINNLITKEIKDKKVDILDIFSGSGCIGISILKNNTQSSVDFGEIKNENIKQIKKNLLLNKVSEDRYHVYQSDVFENVPLKKYDYILANPPYISLERKETVQDSVLNFEDHLALFAEDSGLFFVKKLIKESPKYLRPNGKLYIEYGEDQTMDILEFLKMQGISNYSIIKDQYEKDRVLVVT